MQIFKYFFPRMRNLHLEILKNSIEWRKNYFHNFYAPPCIILNVYIRIRR